MKMRFYRDDPRTVTVRWFFVEDDCPFVPYPNAFMSSIWQADDEPVSIVGEVPYSQSGWDNGLKPANLPPPDQRRASGTPEQWARGQALPPAVPVALNADGGLAACPCCGPNVPFPFNAQLWLTAADVPGPDHASVGVWMDHQKGTPGATQESPPLWPDLDIQGAIKGVEFEGVEKMTTSPPLPVTRAEAWCVFEMEGEGNGNLFGFYDDGNLDGLWAANVPSLGLRGVNLQLYSDNYPSIVVEGTGPSGLVYAHFRQDETTAVLESWGGIVGRDEKVSGFDPAKAFKFLGPIVSNPYGNFRLKIHELLTWTCLLTDARNAAVLNYLRQKYEGDPDMRPGTVIDFAGALVPSGYLACDGTDYADADYPELSAALGGAWDTFRGQAAPAAGRFRVPLLNGLTTIGVGAADSNPTTTARALADTLGEEEHTIVGLEVGDHYHAFGTRSSAISPNPGNTSIQATADAVESVFTTTATGAATPHNNMQPSVALLKCIKT